MSMTRAIRILLLLPVLTLAAAGCGDDGDDATPVAAGGSPSSEAPPPEELPEATISAQFSCGPADGHWIDATAEVDAATRVVAELVVDGMDSSRSAPVSAAPGVPVDIGWAPSFASQETGTVRLLRAGDDAELATTVIELRLPGGTFCG